MLAHSPASACRCRQTRRTTNLQHAAHAAVVAAADSARAAFPAVHFSHQRDKRGAEGYRGPIQAKRNPVDVVAVRHDRKGSRIMEAKKGQRREPHDRFGLSGSARRLRCEYPVQPELDGPPRSRCRALSFADGSCNRESDPMCLWSPRLKSPPEKRPCPFRLTPRPADGNRKRSLSRGGPLRRAARSI